MKPIRSSNRSERKEVSPDFNIEASTDGPAGGEILLDIIDGKADFGYAAAVEEVEEMLYQSELRANGVLTGLSPECVVRRVDAVSARSRSSSRMSYFPIFLEMKSRRCLVVGGGTVAERKIAGLLDVGAAVTVISPDATETIAYWSQRNMIRFLARRYRLGDLSGYELAFAATGDAVVNTEVFTEARRLGVWVNSADDPKHCDFILPSVLRRGDLTVAVSSGGGSPALARTIREELELHLSEEYEQLAKLAAEAREEAHRRSLSIPFETWRRALSGDVRRYLMRGELARAKSQLLKELGVV
jgi:siroheme synthase-like protein